NPVVCARAVSPLIGMGPDTQLELKPTGSGFGGDKPQHLKISISLFSRKRSGGWKLFPVFAGKLNNSDVVTRDIDQVGVRELEVVVGHVDGEIVSKSEGEIEPVKPACHERIQVSSPKFLVVIPRLILDSTAESPGNASDSVCWLLFFDLVKVQGECRIAAEFDSLGQLQKAIDETSRIGAGNPNRGGSRQAPRHHADAFGAS